MAILILTYRVCVYGFGIQEGCIEFTATCPTSKIVVCSYYMCYLQALISILKYGIRYGTDIPHKITGDTRNDKRRSVEMDRSKADLC